MSLGANIWPLRTNQDVEKDHRAILLERNSQRCQEAGKYYEIFCANVLFKTSLMLAGTNMPGMPKDEQEAGEEARAASSSSQVTVAPLGNGF